MKEQRDINFMKSATALWMLLELVIVLLFALVYFFVDDGALWFSIFIASLIIVILITYFSWRKK